MIFFLEDGECNLEEINKDSVVPVNNPKKLQMANESVWTKTDEKSYSSGKPQFHSLFIVFC